MYYINGMHCEGCARKAARVLRELPGVTRAQVNFITTAAAIEAPSVSHDLLSTTIQEAGYELSTRPPAWVIPLSRWVRKYLPLIATFSAVLAWTALHRYVAG